MTKITSISVRNFERIISADVTPGTHLFIVGGKNGHGKSSLLDAVKSVLGGKRASPDEAVHFGAEQADTTIKLDNGLEIRKKIKPDGSESVSVTRSIDGALAKVSSPQQLLSQLAGSLALDPFALMRLDDKAQLKVLRDLTGLDTSSFDVAEKKAFDERTDVGRRGKELSAQIEGIPLDESAPTAPADTAELMRQLAAEQAKTSAVEAGKRSIEAAQRKVASAEAEVERLTALLAQAESAAATARSELVRVSESAPCDAGNDAPIREAIANASDDNARYEAQVRRRKLVEQRQAMTDKWQALTSTIDKARADKAAAIAAAKMPIDGLELTETGVRYLGAPLKQASSAQQLQVSLAIAAALAPQLRTLLIREGALLDEDSLAAVAKFCESNDIQVLMERVGIGEECSIVMHDGMVLS